MKLYTYWRSSAAYRVRIALELKGLNYDSQFVHLVREGGEQLKAGYSAINPQKLVPSLVLGDGTILTQSMAILEYLQETYPTPALLPEDSFSRAYIRGLCQNIASEIHPLDNLRVLNYLTGEMGLDKNRKMIWYKHWIALGFKAFETTLSHSDLTGSFCFGEAPTFADICLVPQVYNARRFEMDLSPYPNIVRIDANCQKLDGFKAGLPENQRDADL